MKNDEKTAQQQQPSIIEGDSREEVTKAVRAFREANPKAVVSMVFFDGAKAKPFWANVTSKTK